MKTGTLHEIRKELMELEPQRLSELCLLLAKYKKENKAYLDYLLFQSHDRQAFAGEVKEDIRALFAAINTDNNLYYIKKSIRKIQRLLNRYCKYVDDKALETEMHIYFLKELKHSGIPFHKNKVLVNLYENERKKINGLLRLIHEDLRADYNNDLEELDWETWKD